jgi:hypothetical protein
MKLVCLRSPCESNRIAPNAPVHPLNRQGEHHGLRPRALAVRPRATTSKLTPHNIFQCGVCEIHCESSLPPKSHRSHSCQIDGLQISLLPGVTGEKACDQGLRLVYNCSSLGNQNGNPGSCSSRARSRFLFQTCHLLRIKNERRMRGHNLLRADAPATIRWAARATAISTTSWARPLEVGGQMY